MHTHTRTTFGMCVSLSTYCKIKEKQCISFCYQYYKNNELPNLPIILLPSANVLSMYVLLLLVLPVLFFNMMEIHLTYVVSDF